MDRATSIADNFHSAAGRLAGVKLEAVVLPPALQPNFVPKPKTEPESEATSKFGALPTWGKVAIIGGSALALAGIIYGVRYAVKHKKSVAPAR